MILGNTTLQSASRMMGINPDHVNPASVDIALGATVVELGGSAGKLTYHLAEGETVELRPGHSYLVHSEETTAIGEDEAVFLLPKSSISRQGVQMNVGWGDPGFVGQWTFLLTPSVPVTLKRGQRVAQLVWMICDSSDMSYAEVGHYQGSQGVTEAHSDD